ncbi:SGNH/GDSL hydrolase family protein [Saccharothrix sp. Mg75]|uniref:SGNH/GDSL hydrolase family protein n=1 Tax=Saccharothrix sp. Mg75 TaxID=3445357 RepID=UPI003EF037C9
MRRTCAALAAAALGAALVTGTAGDTAVSGDTAVTRDTRDTRDTAAEPAVRVLALGDSITDGFSVPGGYRTGLWRRLVADGHAVDFVGGLSNGPAELGDGDHEGHSGWRIDQLHANAADLVRAAAPRTVLLHIGTNDVGQGVDPANAPARLSALLDRIRTAEPAAEVFVARIVPVDNPVLEARVRAFNAALPAVVAEKGARTHLVDMHTGFTTADLVDRVHPTGTGYDEMAARWYAALRSVPGSLTAPTTLPTTLPTTPVTRRRARRAARRSPR